MMNKTRSDRDVAVIVSQRSLKNVIEIARREATTLDNVAERYKDNPAMKDTMEHINMIALSMWEFIDRTERVIATYE